MKGSGLCQRELVGRFVTRTGDAGRQGSAVTILPTKATGFKLLLEAAKISNLQILGAPGNNLSPAPEGLRDGPRVRRLQTLGSRAGTAPVTLMRNRLCGAGGRGRLARRAAAPPRHRRLPSLPSGPPRGPPSPSPRGPH
jgi:hypothetical protein